MTPAYDNFIDAGATGNIATHSKTSLLRNAWQDWNFSSGGFGWIKPYEGMAILADGHSVDGAPPKLRHVGPDVPACKFFGDEWRLAVNSNRTEKLPIEEFDQFVSEAYFDAVEGAPSWDTIGYLVNQSGCRTRIIYERLLLPVRLENLDINMIVSLTAVTETETLGPLH